ncbi:capsule biosynthesis protein [Alphaproteobacteria bacterium KMM 3653]|uniref:Capsule biosynthesis protein n=1 Tax=Harenicola maris TaxID=2841044 RepID=A0AAP2G970_9RHOB|nr:capsule biosynthesis protein [Harenicola maris]
MTTKLKAKKFRIKRDDPLFEAQDSTQQDSSERPRPKVVHSGDPARKAAPQGKVPIKKSPAKAAPQAQNAQTGEVTSAAEMTTDQQIAAIRKEGLTGRQLRMARRVAQKHGLAPTSDFDAVRLLRASGIDPFQRSNMLEIVKNEGAGKAVANIDPVKLPQTVPAQQPQLPSTQVSAAEARAGEIFRIQRDIAKRRRRKMALLFTRLAFFVFLPTFCAFWYYAFMATPLYSTKTEFVIQQSESQGAAGLGGLFQGTGLAVQQDSTTVQSYLQSRDAMSRLDADHGFKTHFQREDIDALQRLDEDASNEAAYKIYQRNVKIGYDPTEGILKMEVIATTPEASEDFSKALLAYAEEQVDGLTQRLRGNQMEDARASFNTAEEKVREAQLKVLELQEKMGVLDPLTESSSIMQQVTNFEVQLREKQLDLDQQLSNPRPSEAKVAALRGDIGRLEALVAELRDSLTVTVDGNVSLARITGELRIAEADLATRQLLLQQAAAQVETAMIEANRQVRYLSVGVAPIAPDVPTYPRVFENTALAFLIFAGIYLMVSLTASILREQVSS